MREDLNRLRGNVIEWIIAIQTVLVVKRDVLGQ
jgi:hypothetical protein